MQLRFCQQKFNHSQCNRHDCNPSGSVRGHSVAWLVLPQRRFDSRQVKVCYCQKKCCSCYGGGSALEGSVCSSRLCTDELSLFDTGTHVQRHIEYQVTL